LINQAIRDSRYVIALLSSHSLSKRGFVQKELKKALDVVDELPPNEIFVIPVRLEECEPIDDRLLEIQWVDVFPDYADGLQQILRVLVSIQPESQDPIELLVPPEPIPQPEPGRQPPRIQLRSTSLEVSMQNAPKTFGITDVPGRPGEYIQNDYENQGEVVLDHATGLMWQKSGSDSTWSYQGAQKYIENLNRDRFAGYDDWRLPTIPELMSLLEPKRQPNALYSNLIFDSTQQWCWSTDLQGSIASAWHVDFRSGVVDGRGLNVGTYVRAVRSWRAP
jgi:hypothetical protein